METIADFLKSQAYPVFIAIGIALLLFIGMRRFSRRGLGGLQHFPNYFIGLAVLLAEWLLKWTAYALLLWGLYGCLFR